MHPKIAESFADELRGVNCKHIIDNRFRKSKERIFLFLHLSRNLINMTEAQLTKLIRSVSKDERRHLQNILAYILHEIAKPANETPKPTQAETRRCSKKVATNPLSSMILTSSQTSRVSRPLYLSSRKQQWMRTIKLKSTLEAL